jgi:hypothetical protein
MGELPMPGGWILSMAWMRMPGPTWRGAAASFPVNLTLVFSGNPEIT